MTSATQTLSAGCYCAVPTRLCMYAGIATGTLAAAKVQSPAWLSGVCSMRQAPEEPTSCTHTRLRLQFVADEIKDEEGGTFYASGG